MNLRRSVVSALFLTLTSLATAAPARAGTPTDRFAAGHVRERRSYKAVDTQCMLSTNVCHLRVAAPAGEIASVTATLSSAGGDEALTLVETDTRLHGTAAIAALPSESAALTLALYDPRSVAVMTFSGRLGPDGSVVLTADAAPCDASSRQGCTSTAARDVELVAAEVFAVSGAYEIGVDLAGADAYDVAYAELRYTPPCDLYSERGICLSGGRPVTAEVGWDEIGAVWEAEITVAHEGALDARVQTHDATGRALDTTRTTLGLPWGDGTGSVGVLPIDDDARTTVGLFYGEEGARIRNVRSRRLAVVSEGWTLGDALPTAAEVALTGGDPITVPVDSYQRRGRPELMVEDFRWSLGSAASFRLVVDGSTVTVHGGNLTFAELSAPLCAEGTCVVLVPDEDGGYGLSVTQYRWDTAFPADAVDIALTAYARDGAELGSGAWTVPFDDAVTVVFANEVGIDGDPVDAAFTGRVDLLGEVRGNDTLDTLAHGRFYGVLGRDGDGDLGVSGVGVDDVAAADTNFAVLLAGARSACGNDDDGYLAPPPLASVFGNGSGTKNATMTTSTKPQLL